MPEPSFVARVEAARAGDRSAFDALVASFGAMAVGCAYARLRDAELARDVAQEAFLSAFLRLHQLRDPAAFPGWLRRVVLAHAERARRRGDASVTADGPAREIVDPAPGAAHALEAAERDVGIRAAVEALPPAQRMVVALHYFAGEPLERISEFLELPVTTLKKRLFSARRRLEQAQLCAHALRASPTVARALGARVRLFLALRQGDHDGVARLIEGDPELVNATEDWSVEQALERGLPAPTRATPLIRAAERGDLAMVDLLLDRGAPVDGSCRCDSRETALFAALAAGREAVAARLLTRGADPNRRALAGTTPLHVASIRGLEAIVPLLLSHGADSALRDANGRTPNDWARSKGHARIASRLGEANPEPHASAGSSIACADDGVLATGIKAIDLFAPLAPGDLVRLAGGMQVGRNVLLAEISFALAQRHDGCSLYAAWERVAWQEGELEELLAETGLGASVELLRCAPAVSEAERQTLPERALARADALRAGASGPVLLAIFEDVGRAVSVESCYTRLRRRGKPGAAAGAGPLPLTVVLVSALERSALEPPFPLVQPFDAVLRLDPALAERRLYPAIDPEWTRSRNLRPELLGERHCIVSREARALLLRARELDPTLGARNLDLFTGAERSVLGRARRLQAFLTQPFHVAESFSARPGVSVDFAETVETAAALVAGEHATWSPERLAYRGGIAGAAEPPGSTSAT